MIGLSRFLKPFIFMIIMILALVFLQTLADLYLPTLMSYIINNGIIKGDINCIWKTGGIMLLISAGGLMCTVISSYFASKTAFGFGRALRNEIFMKVESFSLQEMDKLGTATLITRTTNDVTQVQTVAITLMYVMIAAPLMMFGGIIMALSQDRALAWVLAAALPVLAAILGFFAKMSMPLFKAIQLKIDRINLVLREKLAGIRVIRAFNRVELENSRFDAANSDLTSNYIRIGRLMSFLTPSIMLIMNLTTIAVLCFGIIRIDSGRMNIGALIAFTQYAFQILYSVIMVSMMFIMIPRASAAAARINEVFDTVPGTMEQKQLKTPEESRGCVEFRNVTFSYEGSKQPAIKNISFTAKPGEITAIIGCTGAGKSSLIKLIPRFYDADSGNVLVDGTDVRDISQEVLRARIGFVPQASIIFSGTIADNIRYGREGASREEIMQASDIAQATEFISGMKEGFDTVVSQGGNELSGGQKQRISIARALIRKPEIYILDDSFSSLDFKTDARIREALKKEIAESTVFIVSQRVSTVMGADRIIVLDNGELAGMGTHKELLKACEVYHNIAASQFSEEETA